MPEPGGKKYDTPSGSDSKTFSMSWKGIDDMLKKVEALGPAGVRALQLALKHEAEMVKRASLKIVPTDQGELRNSCHVDKQATVTPGGAVSITISYGNTAAPYALIQHEALDFKHDKPETAKYLEIPLKAVVSTMGPRLAGFVNLCYGLAVKSGKLPPADSGDSGNQDTGS